MDAGGDGRGGCGMSVTKRYDVILCDPPWQYTGKSVSPNREVTNHYPTMPTSEICKLPINALSSDRCALFLWACWPLLPDAMKVLDAWGFEYKTLAWVWVKAKENGMGFHWGMGGYTRSNSEPCFLAFKKNRELPVKDHGIQSVIYSPVQQHSRKPDDQYRKIETLYPNMQYLELFARRSRLGWDVFGNQVENSITFPTP